MVDTIWLEAQRQLRGALAGREYEFWVAPIRAVRWEADELTLEVPSQFARDWIAREYLALIERAVGLASGREKENARGPTVRLDLSLKPADPSGGEWVI